MADQDGDPFAHDPNEGLMTLDLDTTLTDDDVEYVHYWDTIASATNSATNSSGQGVINIPDDATYTSIWLCTEIRLPQNISKSQIFDLDYRLTVTGADKVYTANTSDTNQIVFMTLYNPNRVRVGTSRNFTCMYQNSYRWSWTDLSSTEGVVSVIRVYEKIDVSPGTTITWYFHDLALTPVSSTGTLGSILDWIKALPDKIKDSLKSLFDSIVQGLTDLKDSFLQALTDLGNFIIDGIKNLFIPDDQFIIDFKADIEDMFKRKFGGLYEAIELIDDTLSVYNRSEKMGEIFMPECTIDLAGAPFTFGGYSVRVVPEGFDVLVNALKTIIDIIATCAFLTAMKKRLEGLFNS